MTPVEQAWYRDVLSERRRQLSVVATSPATAPELDSLLHQVDAALERLESGAFGICNTCHEAIEADRLQKDPLLEYCIDHLTAGDRRRLQQDLELAARIQGGLLPKPGVSGAGWEVQYRYRPAGPVSGDYCDVLVPGADPSSLVFVVADVAGKGVAASLLMAHLSAAFRTLADSGLAVPELVARLNRVFCESIPSTHYATLVCGRAGADGAVELCNAGHPTALWLTGSDVRTVPVTGVPVGMFCSSTYTSEKLKVQRGDSIVLHTDGLTEARGRDGAEYGVERLTRVVAQRRQLAPAELADACLADLADFVGRGTQNDDLTLMVLRRTPAA